jgi:hypothetical protein
MTKESTPPLSVVPEHLALTPVAIMKGDPQREFEAARQRVCGGM